MEFAGLKAGDQVYITGICWPYGKEKIAEVDWVGRLWFTVKGYGRVKFRLDTGRNNTDYGSPYAVSIEAHDLRQRKTAVQAVFLKYRITVTESVLTVEQLEALSAYLPKLGLDA